MTTEDNFEDLEKVAEELDYDLAAALETMLEAVQLLGWTVSFDSTGKACVTFTGKKVLNNG